MALEQQVSQPPTIPAGVAAAASFNPEDLQQLRKEHTELMQLRNEVGTLRRELASANSAERTKGNPSASAGSTVPEAAEAQARQLSKDTIDVMKNLGLAARIYAVDHEDTFPTNFTQLTNELPKKLPGDLTLDGFEFVPQPRAISEREPQLIMFRERAARQLPDGRWARAYTYADGSIVEQVSTDGNFDAFENAHLASGPPPAAPASPVPQVDDALMRRYGLKRQLPTHHSP